MFRRPIFESCLSEIMSLLHNTSNILTHRNRSYTTQTIVKTIFEYHKYVHNKKGKAIKAK